MWTWTSRNMTKAQVTDLGLRCCRWWRGWDLNPRPSGYEPDELPDCSTPRRTNEASSTSTPPSRGRPVNASCSSTARTARWVAFAGRARRGADPRAPGGRSRPLAPRRARPWSASAGWSKRQRRARWAMPLLAVVVGLDARPRGTPGSRRCDRSGGGARRSSSRRRRASGSGRARRSRAARGPRAAAAPGTAARPGCGRACRSRPVRCGRTATTCSRRCSRRRARRSRLLAAERPLHPGQPHARSSRPAAAGRRRDRCGLRRTPQDKSLQKVARWNAGVTNRYQLGPGTRSSHEDRVRR